MITAAGRVGGASLAAPVAVRSRDRHARLTLDTSYSVVRWEDRSFHRPDLASWRPARAAHVNEGGRLAREERALSLTVTSTRAC